MELTLGEELEDYLKKLGMVACQILNILPSKEFSFAVRVDEDCLLEFTIAKKG